MASQFNLANSSEEEETDLTLCLSLGGIYSKGNPLQRSSSSTVAGDRRRVDSPALSLSHSRSCSLPTDTAHDHLISPPPPAPKSVALGRAIGRIKTRSCLNVEGRESATDAVEHGGVGGDPEECELRQNRKKKARGAHGDVLKSWGEVTSRMPSVTTTGEGPNGKRIEGFLYKYTKGQVSIVCVCHGSFLTPAEFVLHAGGTDVDNPMRRINVCSALPL